VRCGKISRTSGGFAAEGEGVYLRNYKCQPPHSFASKCELFFKFVMCMFVMGNKIINKSMNKWFVFSMSFLFKEMGVFGISNNYT
jgi:hypothetical protein